MFLFSRLRRNLPSRILINLCLALMLTLICFVAGADRTEPVYVCRGFAVAIQYFLLASFCWMSVESVNLYLSFVVVMGSYITKFTRKAAIFAWGKSMFHFVLYFLLEIITIWFFLSAPLYELDPLCRSKESFSKLKSLLIAMPGDYNGAFAGELGQKNNEL